MLQKVKVHEIAKDLGLTSKDVIALLENYGIAVKNSTVLEEKNLDIIFEVLSQKFDKGGDMDIPNSNGEYGIIEEEPVVVAPEPPKKEKKPEASKEEPVKPKKERVAVVVNTKTSTVDVSRIEKVERIEEMVSDKIKDNMQSKQKIKKNTQNRFSNKKDKRKELKPVKKMEIKPGQLEIEIPDAISVGELA